MGKNVQNNCIGQSTTTIQYCSPSHTLRAAVVASQQLLQAPRSPESACKRPARNTHKMSTERRKPNRHATQPSWIDPPPSCREYAPAQAVISHLTRTATLTKGQICPERSGQKACEKDGVERHQAIRGYEAALLRRTPGNSRVPETMVTSRVGRSDGKPAFWPSGVRSGVQTAARTVVRDGEGAPRWHQTRGQNEKSATVRSGGIA